MQSRKIVNTEELFENHFAIFVIQEEGYTDEG